MSRTERKKLYKRSIEQAKKEYDELLFKEILNGTYVEGLKQKTGREFSNRYFFNVKMPKNIEDVLLENGIFSTDIELIKDISYLPVYEAEESGRYTYIYKSVPENLRRGSYQLMQGLMQVAADQLGVYAVAGDTMYYFDTKDMNLSAIGTKISDNEWSAFGHTFEGDSNGFVGPDLTARTTDGRRFLFLNGATHGVLLPENLISVEAGGVYEVFIITHGDGTKVIDANSGSEILSTGRRAIWGKSRWLCGALYVEDDNGNFIISSSGEKQTGFEFLRYNKYDFIGKSRNYNCQFRMNDMFLFIKGGLENIEADGKIYTPHTPRYLAESDDFVDVIYSSGDGSTIQKLMCYMSEPLDEQLNIRYFELDYIHGAQRFIKSDKIGAIVDGVFEYYSY